ncbi:hypothetical protein I586_00967 [Enterococcus moraviensis ATCC BAA-383]|uniref:DUF1310 family protein n=3 Tax=Enterococcus moraviensis ATCC BAA-383 TaxID=1158609 RepID=A0ABN0M263_9ENTE|nr:DUF1310 family protein [Enterococcus moraviensis]EOT73971.1 hypothetical protein I586_00967 [Enterococcus moraviensis ATCC BAA-383]
MKNKRLTYLIAIIMTILLIAIGIGGKIYMDKKSFNDEMVKVVKSNEAKKVYERTIKNNDPKAFTADGVIQSYEVDYDTVKHNPMGGIMVDLIVNGDQNLIIDVILDKNNEGILRNSAGGTSSDLDDLLNRKRE